MDMYRTSTSLELLHTFDGSGLGLGTRRAKVHSFIPSAHSPAYPSTGPSLHYQISAPYYPDPPALFGHTYPSRPTASSSLACLIVPYKPSPPCRPSVSTQTLRIRPAQLTLDAEDTDLRAKLAHQATTLLNQSDPVSTGEPRDPQQPSPPHGYVQSSLNPQSQIHPHLRAAGSATATPEIMASNFRPTSPHSGALPSASSAMAVHGLLDPDPDDSTADGRKAKRELSQSKRAAQNRAAQVSRFHCLELFLSSSSASSCIGSAFGDASQYIVLAMDKRLCAREMKFRRKWPFVYREQEPVYQTQTLGLRRLLCPLPSFKLA